MSPNRNQWRLTDKARRALGLGPKPNTPTVGVPLITPPSAPTFDVAWDGPAPPPLTCEDCGATFPAPEDDRG